MPLVEIEIPKWEKFNPRSDRANYSWFRMQNDFLIDPSVFDLNDSQTIIFIYLLCEASKKNKSTVQVNTQYLAAIRKSKESEIIKDINAIAATGLIARPSDGEKPADSRLIAGEQPGVIPATNVTYDTNVTNNKVARATFDLERAYQKYPLKEGKSPGLKILTKEIKTEADYSLLLSAIDRYSQSKKVREGFIKNFRTFAGEWKDWADPTAGTSPNNGGSFQRSEADIEADRYAAEMKERKQAILEGREPNV